MCAIGRMFCESANTSRVVDAPSRITSTMVENFPSEYSTRNALRSAKNVTIKRTANMSAVASSRDIGKRSIRFTIGKKEKRNEAI